MRLTSTLTSSLGLLKLYFQKEIHLKPEWDAIYEAVLTIKNLVYSCCLYESSKMDVPGLCHITIGNSSFSGVFKTLLKTWKTPQNVTVTFKIFVVDTPAAIALQRLKTVAKTIRRRFLKRHKTFDVRFCFRHKLTCDVLMTSFSGLFFLSWNKLMWWRHHDVI